jgi:OOP family OmpA-OmpF porin
MKQKSFFPVLTAIVFSTALAQNGKVLSGDDINESALIQALTPAPDLKSEVLQTRGIRVNRENTVGAMTTTPAKIASASLLIIFHTSSAQLTPEGKRILDIVGKALNSDQLNDYQFLIQGHADPSGNSVSNLKLSQRRAESVRQYLVQDRHVENQRLEAVGKGDKELLNKANPIAPENRRVTIINLKQLKEMGRGK